MPHPVSPSSAAAGFSAPDDEGGRQLHLLARVTAELGAAEQLDEVVEAAVEHAASALGAAVTTLMVLDGDRLRLIGHHGLPSDVAERFHEFDVRADTPAGEAARTGRPVVGTASTAGSYTELRGFTPPGRSVVCLPLGAETPVGVLGLTFDEDWLPGPQELDFLTTFAEACGQALRRLDAAGRAAQRRTQLEFLVKASAVLARTLDDRTTLRNVARLVVPELADWCSVEILDGDHIRTVAIEHADPEMVEWAWTFRRRYPPSLDAPHGVGATLRTGRSQLIRDVPVDVLASLSRDTEHLRQARELGLRSALVVPLVTPSGRVVGAMNLSRATDPRPYTEADLALVEDLGRRAGLAVDNAQLHGRARDTAEQLQRAVLPAALDDLPGWEIATYYEPGGRSGVGGDFYGATVLPDDRLAVFIGDVMGHGIPAAAAMAQLRTSVRAFLTMDPQPVAVVRRLHELFNQLDMPPLATLAYALVDRRAGTVTLLNAGHLTPLLVRPDASVEPARTPSYPVLGVPAGDPRTATYPFGDDDVLLMVTDGLVERRDEAIDVGLDRLAHAAPQLIRPDLTAALDDVIARLRPAEPDDDVAAIAVRARA